FCIRFVACLLSISTLAADPVLGQGVAAFFNPEPAIHTSCQDSALFDQQALAAYLASGFRWRGNPSGWKVSRWAAAGVATAPIVGTSQPVSLLSKWHLPTFMTWMSAAVHLLSFVAWPFLIGFVAAACLISFPWLRRPVIATLITAAASGFMIYHSW